MNFRVVATIEKVTPRGTPYPYTIYVGEFSPMGHDEILAREHARKRMAELNPQIVHYTLSTEAVPEDFFAFN